MRRTAFRSLRAPPCLPPDGEGAGDPRGRRIVGIADDLTGALDAGAAIARQGFPTEILRPRAGARPGAAGAVLRDTESRHLDAGRARERAAEALRSLLPGPPAVLYKKTDSTMRGHVGAEIEALMEAAGLRHAVLAPAFPAAGRTVRGGLLYVDGVPLEETAFARDPRDPVGHSDVAVIVGREFDGSVRRTDLRDLASACREGGASRTVHVVDAESREDLRLLSLELGRMERLPLCAGSAGLAEFLPAVAGWTGGGAPAVVLRPPLLVVNGSLHPASRAQSRRAEAAGMLRRAEDAPRALREAGAALLDAAGVRPGPGAAADLGREAGEVLRAAAAAGRPVGTLLVTGGDTAAAVLDALGLGALSVLGELEPGVAVSAAEGGLLVVSKAGGFGGADLFLRVRERTGATGAGPGSPKEA